MLNKMKNTINFQEKLKKNFYSVTQLIMEFVIDKCKVNKHLINALAPLASVLTLTMQKTPLLLPLTSEIAFGL